jgi:integrase
MPDAKRNLERFLERMGSTKKMLPSNKRKIMDFVKSRLAKGNAPNTIIKYLYPLYQMNVRGWINKDFNKLRKEDIENVLANVENQNWSAKTKKNFKLTLKVFYKWLEGEENFAPGEYPERVKFIVTTVPRREQKELTFDEIVTREEVIRMAQHTLNPMHKALLWVAFESGGRPEEYLNLRKSDIKFDVYGTIIYLKGAKSKRPVRLVSATEPLRDWLRKHPLADKEDFPVWVTQFSKKRSSYEKWTQLGNAGANKMLKTLATRAGINRRITLYSLRKGRATELASQNIPRSVMHAYLGWEEGSTISKRYVKLSMKDLDEAILQANGIEVKSKKFDSFVVCQSCGAKCSPGSLYCENPECGRPLILSGESSRTKLLKELLEDPTFESELLKIITPKRIEKIIENKVQKMLTKAG